MKASLSANRVWPLVLVLAAIVLLLHVTQSASGAETNVKSIVKPGKAACCPDLPCLPNWCQGCVKPKLTCCEDYCRKPAPCIRKPDWCGLIPDYCRKCLPAPPCCALLGCDDYCRKPCPVCPTTECDTPRCVPTCKKR